MLVVMKAQATEEQVRAVCEKIEKLGYRAHPMPGATRTAIGITGNKGEVEQGTLEEMPGVQEVITGFEALQTGQPRREGRKHGHPISGIGGHDWRDRAGHRRRAVRHREPRAGVRRRRARAPCRGAVLPRWRLQAAHFALFVSGARRGRLCRSWRRFASKFGMRIITEAIDHESLDLVEEYADMIQIGARNMQNFSLLKRAGRARKPVLLKRGMSATLEEFLMAAEYILSEGNYNVALCERGVRTFADHTRNTLDLSVVPAVQRLSHLPILVDPSHGTGKRNKVTPLSRAAVAVGADGLMVEVHTQPDQALSDGPQSLFPDQFDELMKQVRQIAAVVGRSVPEIGVRETVAAK